MALFGGQPEPANYLQEARWLLNAYGPLLSEYVCRMSAFLESNSQDYRLKSVYYNGMDALGWFTRNRSVPDDSYLVSVPVCIPLTGLTKLMQIMVLYKTLGISPGELVRHFKVAIGHSQGIVLATAFSMMTDERSFEDISIKALGILMIIGALPQIRFPEYYYFDDSAEHLSSNAKPIPRPLVYVYGINKDTLEAYLSEFNLRQTSDTKHMHLAITNAHDKFVLAGAFQSTANMVRFLHTKIAHTNEDQSKKPFNQRKPVANVGYGNLTVPYHSIIMRSAVTPALSLALEKRWTFAAIDMQIPVRACDDGHDIRGEKDLTRYMFESTYVLPVDWPLVVSVPEITHIVDFGTGGFNGFGRMAYKCLEGKGISVICAGALIPQSHHANMGTKADLYKTRLADVISVPNWLEDFGPKLVRTEHDNKVHIDTRMSRALGMPTVMVAGMTPTTGNIAFVAAITNAGYHVEMAGGVLRTEHDMTNAFNALATMIESGHSITLNCIYVDQRQWNFQFSTLISLRKKGLPIAGLCIGGGVPSIENALDIISAMKANGLCHVSFKPGNVETIRRVVQIARASGGFPVVLQWTGGRAGGHHSFEDFHQPILETYAVIRTCNNIALVAGSGFGNAKDSLPYITGDWSRQLGCAPMPFDGILLGSRVMVAKEAGTSPGAKELIISTNGLPDLDWHKTYDGIEGGVTTITSEYGELNHTLATRAMIFVQEIYKSILSQPREIQPFLLSARKNEIIARLNSDSMRSWFGQTSYGHVVDLENMTYAEVISRAVELMYVKHQQRWIDRSFFKFVVDFINRCECRMTEKLHRTEPRHFASKMAEQYPEIKTRLLLSEDVQFFVALCKRRGQKPVPFIPVLDADFGTMLMKDTIWQSEDLDAVVDRDPQRVAIQQGPVAAQYSTVVDEPIKNILDDIYDSHVSSLIERHYSGDASRVPVVAYIGNNPAAAAATLPIAVHLQVVESARVYVLPTEADQLPNLDQWLWVLSGQQKSWLHALLTAPIIVQGSRYVDNYARRLLRPRTGQVVTVNECDGRPLSVKICAQSRKIDLNVELDDDGCTIQFTIYHISISNANLRLQLQLVYCPSYPLGLIHGSKSRDDQAIRSFFIATWVADFPFSNLGYVDIKSSESALTFDELFTITEGHTRQLCREVGNRSWKHMYSLDNRLLAPIELLQASATRGMLRVIASEFYGSGQLNLVHVSNRIELVDDIPNVFAGDTITTSFAIDGLYNTAAGKILTLRCVIRNQGRHFASLTAEFLGRSHYVDTCKAFKRDVNQKISIMLVSIAEVAVLVAKEWFIANEDATARAEPGVLIDFCLDSEYHFKSNSTYSSITTTGLATVKNRTGKHICIANIDFQWSTATSNPVIEYLKRHQVNLGTHLFGNGGYQLTNPTNLVLSQAVAPSSNQDFARLSRDGNPIHTNLYVAEFAGLPGTIVHGSWTSASAKNAVVYIAADGNPERIRAYQVKFIDMVLPNDHLQTILTHVGMSDGRMLIKGRTSKENGTPVLDLEAEVDQPPTAYVFTGQGAQQVDMGMDLYKESSAARDIWDRANTHTCTAYGFDLLDIVRSNPKQLTVYFNGKAGRHIRSHYMKISDCTLGKGTVDTEISKHSVLSDLTTQSTSYTFQLSGGLLNLTQFTQCAQITMTVATMTDMRSKGLVQSGAMFAGHSFGEVCALAAMADVFSIEDMLDVAFYRGLIMQSAVSRDEQGKSEFGMVSVNPTRISKTFDERLLLLVVSSICNACSGLLRIINYNVRGTQYVVSGILSNLAVLRMVLDKISEDGIPTDTDMEFYIKRIVACVLVNPVDPLPIRGTATTPLTGIDVPSHSEFLLNCVPMFKEILHTRVSLDAAALPKLEHHYIPNLTGIPFEISKMYFETAFRLTRSPVIGNILESWSNDRLEILDKKLRLAELLIVELLAYQLASPVQWIKTQNYLFCTANIRNMVEVGPGPVLCDVAAKALRTPELADKHVSLLHVIRDKDTIYYALANENVESVTEVTEEEQSIIERVSSQDATLAQTTLVSEQLSNPLRIHGAEVQSNPIADVPLRTLDIVHTIVASKIRKSLGNVSVQQNIKTLVAGKSVIQNEIVGDLQKEFGSRVPDKAEEISLQELSTAIGESGGSLGKHTQPLVMRLFSSKMPGGFSLSGIRSILQTSYGLGPRRQDALLLLGLTMEPQARLASKSDAIAWLDSVAKAYAFHADIKYTLAKNLTVSGNQSQIAAVSSTIIEKMQQEQREHVQRQIEVLARYVGVDLRQGSRAAEREQIVSGRMQTHIDSLHTEFGDVYLEGVQPCFDDRKARYFNSYWNWARQDAYHWIQQTINTGTVDYGDVSCTRVCMLQNRADLGLLWLLSGIVSVLSTSDNAMLEPACQLSIKLQNICKHALEQQSVYREYSTPMQPQVRISAEGEVTYAEIARAGEASFEEYVRHMKCNGDNGAPPLIHIREQTGSGHWVYSNTLSNLYYTELDNISNHGVTFAGKAALVTGCGQRSIGVEIVCGLLMGGAKVLATTSSYSRSTMLFFEDIYRRYGARESELIVVPFNQGSVQDIDNLIRYIFDEPISGSTAGLGWNLDFVFPFAAVFDIASISDLGSRSEFAQRVMLTNVLRLIGSIKAAKERSGLLGRPSTVVLPNSSNHGNFGGDGLYGECKSALETVLNRWRSEGWEDYLSIISVQMGWTRGTGLMSPNNLVAQEIESVGVRTFSSREMAFNIIGLLCPLILNIAHDQPIYADLNGGLDRQPHIGEIVKKQRMQISQRSEILRLISWDAALDYTMTHPPHTAGRAVATSISPLARFRSTFPSATDYASLQHLQHLQGMVNLDKVVVITGYGEVGPYGNAETRWEVETFGELSMEGCIELAWIMGLIKHVNGSLPGTGQNYTGWIDAKTNEPVRDVDIKPRYNDYIVEHTGIRLIEPDLVNGYDPAKKQVLREVQIEHDMEPFEAGAEEAAAYKKTVGDYVDVWENRNNSSWSVRFLKGALIRVPVAVDVTRLVAALLPTGWSASRFGVPEDVTKQVDPVTLYTLVATVEALVRSGITDPYELYQHFHVSEIGNSIGSGLGGANAVTEMAYRKRLDQVSRSDTMQETFISTIQAWVNMLLMSSSGPVKPAVGACATAALSIDTAIETIQTGKARVMLAGGVDDIFEESITEFSSMGATVNTVDEYAQGRTPSEMSRPCTSTRKGFMEGHGAGVAVLMSASAAIECGAPIYGIIAMSATATDKQGRSVPAPGRGVVSTARETRTKIVSRMLTISYRSEKLNGRLQELDAWKTYELHKLEKEMAEKCNVESDEMAAYVDEIEVSYIKQRKSLQDTWGNEFWKQCADISPLRGSLAVWGLTADDIGVASFHGTSTRANDVNESNVLNTQLGHIGRTPGHAVPVVCQKWLTGHPKGAAASFILNGILQSLRTGLIPGNRNADNIGSELKKYDYLLYLSKTIQTAGIKAALLKSFGFGQVGSELLIVHPDYVLATINKEKLALYNAKLQQRKVNSDRYWQDVLVGNHTFVQVKSTPPYTAEQEMDVYLDPLARAHYDPKTKEYRF
ncbi:hypothetical protein COEREDRAFT_103271 [Coemansia reversa NRRL 1564]|uniref:Ketosynthase family 3 (KS3) domain-containing protein n=1 Tax=Coemansia reversa (strain ATCC 12441 / NRRL 1564) TaxID=763665 RepID=A0A2G5B7Z5_COERN|nr:hypothetical protein COEREDRAFT_103271 [Coemansia reversa NRRL 1564]|eukprot:PIA14847.1 hypothetical protein COEREDRAFT_103271 [Coemansia reversa NRRL 1564]